MIISSFSAVLAGKKSTAEKTYQCETKLFFPSFVLKISKLFSPSLVFIPRFRVIGFK